ncbi:hypothetical protein [Micromonospora sp. CPCC 205558]|uniref:hypothetical protein n=1 Tax=Micromonospora sp. CPCC 205558 TaxID=3122403 RepID=UPI002FF33192
MAVGAVALGAALGANPARADTPSPRLPLVEVSASPEAIKVSVDDVVEVQLTVPLPVPTAVVDLPVPLPSAVPLPLPSAVPLPTPSKKPTTARPGRPAGAPASPQGTAAPSTSAAPKAPPAPRTSPAPSTSVPATVTRGGAHGTSDGRASDRARAARTAVTGQRPDAPARPVPGPPAFVLALACAPTGGAGGGADPPPSTGEAPQLTPPLRPGLTVGAVDLRATSRPVERGPPPPQQLLITHTRPRR